MTAAAVRKAWVEQLYTIESGGLLSSGEVSGVCSSGLVEVLAALVYEQFEDKLETLHIKAFWQDLWAWKQQHGTMHGGLLQALQGLAAAVNRQSEQLSRFAHQLLLGLLRQNKQSHQGLTAVQPSGAGFKLQQPHCKAEAQPLPTAAIAVLAGLCHKHRSAVACIMLATAQRSLPGLLQQYYQEKLSQLSHVIQQQQEQGRREQDEPSSSDDMADDDAAITVEAVSEGGEEQHPSSHPHHQHSRRATGSTARNPDPLAVLGPDWCTELSVVAQCLEDLGLSAASEEAYTRVINSYVLQQIRALATQEFDTAVLPRAQQLVCAGPLTFLQLLLSHNSQLQAQLQEWRLRLTYLMLETLGALRSSDMFNIVIDFPESASALQDLVLCLQHTNMAGQFAATFKAALEQRLLHAGAATSDIIHTYVSTIRAMKQVDPSGMLLDVISHPIRSYLRSRPDTIRCIVSLLTGDTGEAVHGQASLLEELQQQAQQGAGTQGSQQLPGSFSGTAIAAGGLGADISGPGHCFRYNWCTSEQEGEEAALKLLEALEAGADWAPEESSVAAEQSGMLGLPVCPSSASTAALMGPAGGRVEADVVSMLIGIYGGPLLFMEQYRQMLADRLLAKDEYDCEKEIRTLELLKIRFGEAGLLPCEVMLKDLADSKRLDGNVRAMSHQQQQEMQKHRALSPAAAAALDKCRTTICSYLFWPELLEHDLKLPVDLAAALEVYAERFRHLKAPRKLLWRPALGLVELAVTVGDSQPLNFRVTPIHAALLLQFADDSPAADSPAAAAATAGSSASVGATDQGLCLSAGQLAAALGIPTSVVRQKAIFWVAAGVLLERRGSSGDVEYKRATSIDPSRIVSFEDTDMSWRADSGTANTAEDRIIAEMGPYENYIIGLLTNFGTLGLDRMHNLLRVFVVGEPKYAGKTQEQLAAFLQVLVVQEKIELQNGVYSKQRAAAAP